MKTLKVLIALAVVLILFVPYHSGDINHDGKVTTTDLVQLRLMVEGVVKLTLFADMNYDGLVNKLDLNIMRWKIANEVR